MNIAILFDSGEDDSPLKAFQINGRLMYFYPLEALYTSPEIDEVLLAMAYPESVPGVMEAVEKWEAELHINKPIRVYRGIRSLDQIWLSILQDIGTCPDVIVLHDLRYPAVTEQEIKAVVEKAAAGDVAVTTKAVPDDEQLLTSVNGHLTLIDHAYTGCYPAALPGKSKVLMSLNSYRHILEELGYCEPVMCPAEKVCGPVYTEEELERIEVELL